MSVINTYLNDNVQTPLGRFVVYMLYKQVCINTVTYRTDGAEALMYTAAVASTVEGEVDISRLGQEIV